MLSLHVQFLALHLLLNLLGVLTGFELLVGDGTFVHAKREDNRPPGTAAGEQGKTTTTSQVGCLRPYSGVPTVFANVLHMFGRCSGVPYANGHQCVRLRHSRRRGILPTPGASVVGWIWSYLLRYRCVRFCQPTSTLFCSVTGWLRRPANGLECGFKAGAGPHRNGAKLALAGRVQRLEKIPLTVSSTG